MYIDIISTLVYYLDNPPRVDKQWNFSALPTGQGNLQIEVLGFMDVAAYVT